MDNDVNVTGLDEATLDLGKEKFLFVDSIRHAVDPFELASKGNKQEHKLVDEVVYNLAQGFAATVLVIYHEVFIPGDEVMKSKENYFNRFRNYFKELVFPGMCDIEFAYAKFNKPGIIGATMLPLTYIKK